MVFELDTRNECAMHTHQDIEIMYVKSGGLELEEEGKHYTLKENDFFLINSNNRHGYTTQKNTLIGRFIIKYDEISDILQRDLVAFRCNSVEKRAKIDSKAYQELEQLIKDIFIQHYTKKREDYFLLESMQQRLLYLLVRDYMEEVTSLDHPLSLHQKAQRNQQLVDYIKQNYMNPLSLNELADKFFLSSAYLSKYFKRQFGLNFREYLRVIRLQRAVEAMLQTNKPLLQIAMEVGFPNINSFNHAFRNYYGETPSVYRKKQIAFDEAGQEEEQKKEGERREKPMESYQDFNAEHMVDHQVVYVICSNPKTLVRNWNRVINVGSLAQLMQPNMQSHVLQLRNELHFRYVRIWGLYDEETFLMSQGAEHTYYYGVLDSVLDFLTTNHIKPWLELGAKGKKIVGTNRKRIYDSSKFNVFKDEKSLREFMHELMTHLVNRYGMEVVAEWYFELWGQEINEKEKSAVGFHKYVQDYLDNFEIAAGAIRGVIKEAHIGGSGIPCNYGETVILDLFSKWTKREQKPDFVSISVYPYVIQDSTEESIQGRFISPSFLAKMIEKVEMIKNHSGLEACQLHVTEWNLSIVSNNYIHDSCLKGAYILKNVIDIIGCDSILAYWVGSDLSLYCGGKQRCLNGAGGLLTTDGIRKPAWWAFDFLNSLGKRFFLKTDHCIVTDDGYGNWRIACHNYTHLNHKYYMMEEGTVKVSEIQDVCMDTKCENLSFILPTDEDKMYQIKIYSVNTQHGSVLNEWQNMSFEEAMSKEDINYLRSICIPNLRIINVMSEDGELSFDTLLEQNEIQLIQVNQLMK